jgi:putative transposase
MLTGAIRDGLREMLVGLGLGLGLALDRLAIDPDQVHLGLGAPPRWSPADMAHRLQQESGQQWLGTFPELGQQFWKGQWWARG